MRRQKRLAKLNILRKHLKLIAQVEDRGAHDPTDPRRTQWLSNKLRGLSNVGKEDVFDIDEDAQNAVEFRTKQGPVNVSFDPVEDGVAVSIYPYGDITSEASKKAERDVAVFLSFGRSDISWETGAETAGLLTAIVPEDTAEAWKNKLLEIEGAYLTQAREA